ncbi:MAG: hypothetical protein IJ087_15095, partial [Eggerthellaceae bacterium]|nr:hypothetical protein [Eggerthellaceae bacterium]
QPEPEPVVEPVPEFQTEPDKATKDDAAENLTEQTIGDLEDIDRFSDEDVPPLDVPLPGASERIAELIDQLGAAPEQKVESALDPLTEMKIEEIIPVEPQSTPPTPTSAVGNASAAQTSADSDDQVENFFAKQNRDIEMPPEKKKGFFARFRGE